METSGYIILTILSLLFLVGSVCIIMSIFSTDNKDTIIYSTITTPKETTKEIDAYLFDEYRITL